MSPCTCAAAARIQCTQACGNYAVGIMMQRALTHFHLQVRGQERACQMRTLEGVCEGLVEQPVGDLLDVLRQRVAGALIHCILRDLV